MSSKESAVSDKSGTASEQNYRQQGNEAYKRGDLRSAIDLYTQAIKDEAAPVHYSNRSACYYELGMYRESLDDIKKALALVEKLPKDEKKQSAALVSKLGIRRKKAAFYLDQPPPLEVDERGDILLQIPTKRSTVISNRMYSPTSIDDAISGLSGHISTATSERCWNTIHGKRTMYDPRYYIEEEGSRIKYGYNGNAVYLFFGGVNDGREVFVSLLDAYMVLPKPGNAAYAASNTPSGTASSGSSTGGSSSTSTSKKKGKNKKGDASVPSSSTSSSTSSSSSSSSTSSSKPDIDVLHMVLNDVNGAVLTRCIVMLSSLWKFGRFCEPTLQGINYKSDAYLLLLVCQYVFTGVAMPRIVYDRLVVLLNEILSVDPKNLPPFLEWLHVNPNDWKKYIFPEIEFWLEVGEKLSTKDALDSYEIDLEADRPKQASGLKAVEKRKESLLKTFDEAKDDEIIDAWHNMVASLPISQRPETTSVEEKRKLLRKALGSMDSADDFGFYIASQLGCYRDLAVLQETKTLPYDGVYVLEPAWVTAMKGKGKLKDYVHKTWKVNPTLLSAQKMGGTGLKNYRPSFNPLLVAIGLYAHDWVPIPPLSLPHPIFTDLDSQTKYRGNTVTPGPRFDHWIQSFFFHVGHAFYALADQNAVKVYLSCESVLTSVERYVFTGSPKLHRLILGHTPDTEGLLPVFTSMAAAVRTDPNCFIHCVVGHGLGSKLWKNLVEYVHSSTLIPSEAHLLTMLGVDAVHGGLFTKYVRWSVVPSLNLTRTTTKPEMVLWLHRLFLFICQPPTRVQSKSEHVESCPLNLNSLFMVMQRLIELHVPFHWLVEFVEHIISDSLTTRALPPTSSPIDVGQYQQAVSRKPQPCNVCPYSLEVLHLASLWFPKLRLKTPLPLVPRSHFKQYAICLNTLSTHQKPTSFGCVGLVVQLSTLVPRSSEGNIPFLDALSGVNSETTELKAMIQGYPQRKSRTVYAYPMHVFSVVDWIHFSSMERREKPVAVVFFLLPVETFEWLSRTGYSCYAIRTDTWKTISGSCPLSKAQLRV